jgi:hypothetical protein
VRVVDARCAIMAVLNACDERDGACRALGVRA